MPLPSTRSLRSTLHVQASSVSRQPSLVTAQPALLVYVLLRPLPPAAALAHPLAYDGPPLCVVDVGWQQEFLGQDHRCLQCLTREVQERRGARSGSATE